MRQSTSQYAAVFAKCRAKFATLLRDDDYHALASIKSVSGVASFLMHNSDYSDDLKGVDINNISRAQLEELLYANLMRSYKSLYVFTHGTLRGFIGAMTRKFNINIILKLAMKLSNPTLIGDDGIGVVLNSANNDVDMLKISAAQNLEQLKAAVEDTKYKKIFADSIEDGKLNYLTLEVALYNDYYNQIYSKFVDKRKGAANESIKKLLHLDVDLTNISIILRMKFAFDAKADKVIPLLLTIKGGRDRREYIMLCEMTKSEFVEYLRSSKYRKLAFIGENMSTAEYMSNYLNVYYRRLMNSPTPSFEHPFAYLWLKELEIQNLIHVIEGIRYGISPEKIIEKIITVETDFSKLNENISERDII